MTTIIGIKEPSDEEQPHVVILTWMSGRRHSMCGNSLALSTLLKPNAYLNVLDLASMSVIDDRSYRRSSYLLRRKLH